MPRKKNSPTPSLFGDATEPAARKPRKPNVLGPWWEAVAKLIGFEACKAAGGRAWKVAGSIRAAGIDPAELDRLPELVRQYAAWRTVLDIAAVQQCFIWIKEPPRVVQGRPSAVRDAVSSIRVNGGTKPF